MIVVGDCLDVLRTMDANSVDAIVTDPPYGLTQARPGGRSEATRGPVMGGFMGMKWDADVPSVDVWAECLRVLKPGGYLLAFAGTRTQHRMAVRIEDAGFEIRDMIAWVYGSGFPKSHNGPWGGTALKPALEPITVARKPLIGTVAENVQAHGTGGLNIDGCRVGSEGARNNGRAAGTNGIYGHIGATEPTDYGKGRWPANLIHDGSDEVLAAFPLSEVSGSAKNGTRSNARPDGIFGKRPQGQLHNDTGSAARFFYCAKASRKERNDGCEGFEDKPLLWSSGEANPGSFQAEGTKRAAQNNHPTVKPTDLMRYLCRLVTPPGGLVLDPFAGSGSTGRGAILEGFRFLGIERDPDYAAIAEARIAAVMPKPEAPKPAHPQLSMFDEAAA